MRILEVAKWNATDNEIIACKFVGSSHDDRFNTKSRLIVSTGQEAVVVINGKMTGPFKPCLDGYTMNTKNLPILTDIWSKLIYSGDTPYPAEIWFVQVASAPDFGWGTPTPVTFGAEYNSNGIRLDLTVGVTMYGMMELSIVDTVKFMEKIVQTKPVYHRNDLRDILNAKLMQVIKPALVRYVRSENVSIRDIAFAQDQIGKMIFNVLKDEISEYGLNILSFNVEDIRLTPATESKINELDEKASEVAREALERRTLDMSRKEERQFDVAEMASANEGAGSIIAPLVGASVGLGIAGGIAANVAKAMPDMSNTVPPPRSSTSSIPPSLPVYEYMIAVEGKQYGPYKVTDILKWMKEGTFKLSPDMLVWRAGMVSWIRCVDCEELSFLLQKENNLNPPPLPTGL